MSRFYAVPYTGTVTNAGGNADLLEVLPADDKPVRLRGMWLAQTSELGDAAEESPRISIIRMTATVTSSNGTAVTPVPMDGADTAAGCSAECNGATVATTSGASTVWGEFAWNLRGSPLDLWFPDERFCPSAKQGEGLFVRLQDTLADDITVAMTFFIEEVS